MQDHRRGDGSSEHEALLYSPAAFLPFTSAIEGHHTSYNLQLFPAADRDAACYG